MAVLFSTLAVPALPQYPYSHELVQDETHPRSFGLNDLALLLAQQLPVALLPLQQAVLRTAPAAGDAAAQPGGSQQQAQQQQQQLGRPQATRAPSGSGPQTRSRAQQQEAGGQASPAADAAAGLAAARQRLAGWQERALLDALPLLDQLMGRLLDTVDVASRPRADSAVGSIRLVQLCRGSLSGVSLLTWHIKLLSSWFDAPCAHPALPIC